MKNRHSFIYIFLLLVYSTSVSMAQSEKVPSQKQSDKIPQEVNIYTLRQPELLNPLLKKFTDQTGIKVNATWVQNGILSRLEAEGKNSAADAIISVDVSRLEEINKAELLEPINDNKIITRVPAYLRESENNWIGLTRRARLIIASKERVAPEDAPKTYEDLADPKWKGKICTRSGKHAYNIGLIASMIAEHGESYTKTWLQGLKNNLARKPTGNDRAQARAIYEGACDIALINSYYLGIMATNTKEKQQQEWYNSVNIIFPNQSNRGTHVNISGIGVLKHAKNKDNAIKLVEYLLSNSAQQDYANLNFEYPVVSYNSNENRAETNENKNQLPIKLSPIVTSWGEFKSDELHLQKISEYSSKASQLVDEVKYDL